MKNILVLGGTGAMGSHLVEILAAQGDQVSVTTRARRKPRTNIKYIQGNAQNDDFLEILLSRKWDAIVDFMVYSTPAFEQRAFKLLSATDQYIYLSSARVYADSYDKIGEDTPRLLDSTTDYSFLATDEYSLAKARQENILLQSGGTNWTIIRPYITYSEQRLQLGVLEKEEWLYRALKGRTIVFSETVRHRLTTLTYGYDVAVVMAKLLGHPSALGEVFHITSNNAHSWDSILSIYTKAIEEFLGDKPRVFYHGLKDCLIWKQRNYQIIYDRLYDRSFSNEKTKNIVGDIAFVDARRGLERCIVNFLKDPDFQAINWRGEALKDKMTGDVTPLSEIKGIKSKIQYILIRYIPEPILIFLVKLNERFLHR